MVRKQTKTTEAIINLFELEEAEDRGTARGAWYGMLLGVIGGLVIGAIL